MLLRSTKSIFARSFGVVCIFGVLTPHAPGAEASAGTGPATTLPTYIISVARTPQDAATLPIVVRTISADRLASTTTIDGALRDDPAFSLFRRNTSLSANPTAHGVSLRGVGPSGASRTAVMLDGLPLNDPFGGWITWGQIPGLSLAGAEVAHGGGSGVWGNAALGGTVALEITPLDDTAGRFSAQAGDRGFWRMELTHTQAVGADDALRLDARTEGYSGFHALRAGDRGAVDRALSHTHHLGQFTWRHALSPETDARLTLRTFAEDRSNGTVLQDNSTRLAHLAFGLEGRDGAQPLWRAAVWAQRQEYTSFFTAVSADRMLETPANDQFAVPADAAGLLAHRIFAGEGSTTIIGLDGRWVDGETREDTIFRAGAFAQRRKAGGAQTTAGLFAHHDRAVGNDWHLSGALRIDHWATTRGHNRETSLETGALLRDESFPDRDGIMGSPRLGVSGIVAPRTTLRAAVYRAFRLPTLNEYHRPFRVGNTTTRANPELDTETLSGFDLGLETQVASLRLAAGGFVNVVDGAVGNITLSSGPTGTIRQRQNLDETRIQGLEFSVDWRPVDALRLRAASLLVDARIISARAQPALVGRRVPQVPRHAFTFSADWRATPDTRMSARLRASSQQFEDDENQLPLASACTLDLRIDHHVSAAVDIFIELGNAFDAPAETSRSAAGLVTYDQPRNLRAGITCSW